MDTPTISESRDGTGAGDHNAEYTFGTPCSYLTTVQRGNLLIMRGYVMDFRRGERGGAADGDLGYADTVLHVAAATPPTPDPTHDPMPDEAAYDG